MFDLLQEKENDLVISKSVMIKAASCLYYNGENDVGIEAKTSLIKMIRMMDVYLESQKSVIIQYKDNAGLRSKRFTSINLFKIWLIRYQDNNYFKVVLDLLKDYYKKRAPLPDINIVFGNYRPFIDQPDYIYNTEVYFKNTFSRIEGWLDKDLIKKAVKAVDKSVVINEDTINSPVFGNMSPSKLSGGVKTLILIYNNPEMIFNASTCGDNCVKWIEKFAKEKDFVICLYHTMRFSEKRFKAYIVNADVVVDNYEDYIMYSDKYCREAK